MRGEKPSFVPVAFAFGGAFHAALAYAYGMLKIAGTLPELEAIVQVFIDVWANITSGPVPMQREPEDREVDHVAKAREMLTVWHDNAKSAENVQVHDVEMSFMVDLHDADTGEVLEEKLVGVIDLVLREGKRHVLVEHKSSARRYSADQLEHDVQPTAYRHAARLLGLGDAGLRYQIVTKTKVPSIQIENVQRTDADTDDFLRVVVGVLRAIEARAFYPIRGWQCRTCPFATPCTESRMARST